MGHAAAGSNIHTGQWANPVHISTINDVILAAASCHATPSTLVLKEIYKFATALLRRGKT